MIAFGDANALWEPDALRELVKPFADPAVGYVCGQVTFINEAGTNQEGLYWRYEMFLRAQESALASVTGGNGAIYAVRREAYVEVDPIMGHDLSFPFRMVKNGWRAVYQPSAPRDARRWCPSIEGEWAAQAADDVPRLADRAPGRPRRPARLPAAVRADDRLPPAAALRRRRSCTSRRRSRRSRCCAAAASTGSPRSPRPRWSPPRSAGRSRAKPALVARYYVLTTAALAAGLYDWLRHGTPAGWDAPEGTR